MLSKKQAKTFFLGGTLVTFLIFIGLTIYSFSQENDQTNYGELSDSAVRGKEIWKKLHLKSFLKKPLKRNLQELGQEFWLKNSIN